MTVITAIAAHILWRHFFFFKFEVSLIVLSIDLKETF